MNLTPQQKIDLKTHLQANTNTVVNVLNGQTVAINTLLGLPPNSENMQRIAAWYNGLALGGDNQPVTTRSLWNPLTTIKQLNTAIRWQDLIPSDGGLANATEQYLSRCEKWLRWQSMIWNQNQGIDMTDAQVRAGVLAVFGDAGSPSSANAVGATGCGRLDGRRIELVPNIVGNATGAATAWGNARVCPSNVFGQTLNGSDLEEILLNT